MYQAHVGPVGDQHPANRYDCLNDVHQHRNECFCAAKERIPARLVSAKPSRDKRLVNNRVVAYPRIPLRDRGDELKKESWKLRIRKAAREPLRKTRVVQRIKYRLDSQLPHSV